MRGAANLITVLVVAGVCGVVTVAPSEAQTPWREQVLARLRERLSDPSADRQFLVDRYILPVLEQ